MVSWMVKQAMLDVARDTGLKFDEPKTREDWARLAQRAGIKGIHIAERDTQRARDPKPPGKFVNTWSVEGFVSEGMQPAELGWGTHEKALPANGASTTSAAAQRSICCSRGPAPACARGRRPLGRSTAFW
jgi:Homospermidine synthase